VFYPFYFTMVSVGAVGPVFVIWFVLWHNEFITSQPSWGVFPLSLWVGAFFSMEKWRERQGQKVRSWINWTAPSYFGDALSYVGFSFVVWYVAWALLWKYHMVSSPPTGGWWNWAIFFFGFLALLHSFKKEVVARENAAGIGSYRVDYGREAALGAFDGAWIFGVVWLLGLNTTAPENFKWMAAFFVISGGFAAIVRHAGRQRDYPLAMVDDVMNGVIAGAIAGALLYVLWTIATRSVFVNGTFYVWLFVGAVVGAILNYFRKNGAVTGEGAFSRLLGIAAGGALRGKGLAAGLFFGAIGFVILWLFVPMLLETLNTRPVDTFLLIVSAAGTAVGGYFFLGRGLGGIREALGFSRLGTDTHGDARLATARELREGGLIPRGGGIYLGRQLSEGAERDAVGYPGGAHLLTIGPAGSGKGTGLIIPNLATLRRSILIIDPKGEAAAVTARKRAQFGRVLIINPFEVLTDERPYLKSDGYNPLAALDPEHENFTDDCKGIGQALVKEQTGGNSEFFSGSAQDLVTALVMYEKLERRDKANLGHVRTLLTEPFMQAADGEPLGLQKTIYEMTQSRCEPLRQKAGRFARANKTTFDIIATAANETSFLDSPPMMRDLAGEAFDWDAMKREITTVYLILPADRLETHANYMRLVVTSALRVLLRSRPSAKLPPVLFMLDEFAQLKYLPSIENAMAIARGFGVQLWPFLQDLNQLNALYKDRWQTFMGNSAVLTAFAPRDMFTAKYLSEKCGNKTIIVESENERTSGSGMGRSRGPQGVPLFRPEALMGMPAGQLLCFADPVKNPFMTMARGYWTTDLREGLDSNPYRSSP
jgi:type IV secretion system protein VirD4